MEHDLASRPQIHRGITSPNLKAACFVLEALNGLATVYFFYFLYFYTEKRFFFTPMQDLMLAALLGLVYAFGAYYGGKFAQKFGYLTAVRAGAAIMIAAFLACSATGSVWLTIALAVMGSLGMCLTWPAMEALVSEGEPPARLPGLVGFYNVVWAATAGFAYFTAGAMQHSWGWGASMFYVPAGILAIEFGVATWLEGEAQKQPEVAQRSEIPILHVIKETYRSPIPPAAFLTLALVANPMAYLAINTVISSMPAVAARLGLSPMMAGFVCSIWLFARAVAFVGLWMWPGWHYRFRYLAIAFVVLIASFAILLLVPHFWTLVLAQLAFGPAIGLIYYSALFYSMDVGEAKGEHGGVHEAVIGVGNCVGPAMAASALKFFPDHPGSGAWAVTFMLLPGLAALFWLRYREPKRQAL